MACTVSGGGGVAGEYWAWDPKGIIQAQGRGSIMSVLKVCFCRPPISLIAEESRTWIRGQNRGPDRKAIKAQGSITSKPSLAGQMMNVSLDISDCVVLCGLCLKYYSEICWTHYTRFWIQCVLMSPNKSCHFSVWSSQGQRSKMNTIQLSRGKAMPL